MKVALSRFGVGLLALGCGDGARRESLPPVSTAGAAGELTGSGGGAGGPFDAGGVSSVAGTGAGHGAAGPAGAAGAAGARSLGTVEPGHGPGRYYEVALTSAAPVASGRFSMYVPDGAPRLFGMLVHQHGCGRGGFDVPHDLHWQALANRWSMALVGTEFPTLFDDGDHCERWSHLENGSAELFLEGIAALAAKAGHSELVAAPWALWGHSGGATWAFQMSKRYPARTLAVVLKSICEPDQDFDPVLLTIPTLLATGPQDLGSCYPTTTGIFQSYRAAHAPWAYVDEPEGTHETKRLRYLAIPYLDAAIAARLDPAAPTVLRAISPETGALKDDSFLPSEGVAQAWQEFVDTGTVVDRSAPELAPRLVGALLADGQVTLSWTADADLHSGIAAFQVYRDGAAAQRVPAGGASFQGWNYGDEPEPVSPAMTIIDSTPGQSYRVSVINGGGLESPSSEPLAPSP